MRRWRLAGVGSAIGLFFVGAQAYELNPVEDKYRWDGDRTHWKWVADPMHEELTLRARACAAGHEASKPEDVRCGMSPSVPAGHHRGHKHDSLVRGVWWNDDPNQLLFALRQAEWGAWMLDGEHIATHKRNLRGKSAQIDKTYYINYRSHYGDLQFLHAMASGDKVAPRTTQQNILTWAEFTYKVAIGSIGTESTLGQVEVPGFGEFFGHLNGWSVSYLFAPKYLLRSGDHFSQMALGSLLHVIQDSFSAAHVERAFNATGTCPRGRVIRFNTYVGQVKSAHKAADVRIAWLDQKYGDFQGPIDASAALLSLASRKADWEKEVKPYLENAVFCLGNDAEPSNHGGFNQHH